MKERRKKGKNEDKQTKRTEERRKRKPDGSHER